MSSSAERQRCVMTMEIRMVMMVMIIMVVVILSVILSLSSCSDSFNNSFISYITHTHSG